VPSGLQLRALAPPRGAHGGGGQVPLGWPDPRAVHRSPRPGPGRLRAVGVLAPGRRRRELRAAPGGRGGWRLSRDGRRGGGAVREDRRVLAPVALRLHLYRPMARDGAPVRPGPEAADLRAHRGDGGGGDLQPPGGPRRRAQLGLPVHVDTGRRLDDVRAHADRVRAGGRPLHEVARRPLPPASSRRIAPAPVQDRRPSGGVGGHPRPPRRLPGLTPRPRRQRSLPPAPARRLRRADGLRLPL
jgi:hypothetical protein